MQFTPTQDFEYKKDGKLIAVYCKGLNYTVRTSELAKQVGRWHKDGKIQLLTGSSPVSGKGR